MPYRLDPSATPRAWTGFVLSNACSDRCAKQDKDRRFHALYDIRSGSARRLDGQGRTKGQDKQVLKLIRRYLEAGVMADGLVHASEEGTPQGSPLSPLLSNVMLDDLDWELDRRGHRFVRYADDGRIYVKSERAGQRVMVSITQYVEQRLKLKVNREKSVVDLAKKRFLLGFGFFGRDGEIKVRVSPKALKRAKDRLRQLTSRKWSVSMEQRIEEINRFTAGWTAYFALAETPSPFERLDGWLRRRLRQVRWKEWKNPRSKLRRLRAAGIPNAKPANGRTRARATGASRILQSSPAPPQRPLDRPGPGRVRRPLPTFPGCQANRRMRTRTSGGVGGAGVSPAPTRSTDSTGQRCRGRSAGSVRQAVIVSVSTASGVAAGSSTSSS